MILQNSIGFDDKIRSLLLKSAYTMTPKEIDAWMRYEYDPAHMFCMFQDDILVACLQTKIHTMVYANEQLSVSTITLAATLPDYRQRNYHTMLLEAACQQATFNHLMMMTYTQMPKLYENNRFRPIYQTKEYWINSKLCLKGDRSHVVENYNDLYSVYFQFMQYFDGSIILEQPEFDKKLLYHLHSGKHIVTMYDDDHEMRGFAIYSTYESRAHIEMMVYLDSDAIFDLLSALAHAYEVISLVVTEFERFDKLFPSQHPRSNGTLMARLNNYKLFNKWQHAHVKNVYDVYESIDGPLWSHYH